MRQPENAGQTIRKGPGSGNEDGEQVDSNSKRRRRKRLGGLENWLSPILDDQFDSGFLNGLEIAGSGLQLKAVDDLVNRYAGEREYQELLSVARGVADDGLVMSLQIFGKNVSIQEGFDHRSEHDRRVRGAPSLLVSDGDNLIQ
jgi:hypothetical protein